MFNFMKGKIMGWYLKVWKNYFNFNGRARRREYWIFVLMNSAIGVVLSTLENLLSLFFLTVIAGTLVKIGILTLLFNLAILIPSIAVGIRRMHDVGKSGWWLLIPIIPIIGWIWFLVLTIKDSDPNENDYGINPKMYD